MTLQEAKDALAAEKAKGDKADPAKIAELEKACEEAKSAKSEDTKVLTEDEVKSLVSGQMKSVLAESGIPQALKQAITEDGIAKAVTKAMADYTGKQVTLDQAKTISEHAMKTILNDTKMPSRLTYSSERNQENVDMGMGGQTNRGVSRGIIEYPYSWAGGKSNLPPHAVQLLNVMMTKDFSRMNEGIDEALLRRCEENGQKSLDSLRNTAREAVIAEKSWLAGSKALTAAAAGSGAELVAIELSSILQRRFFLESQVAALFAAREIDQPVEAYQIPMITTLPNFFVGATESTATNESSPGTTQPTLTAVKLMGETAYSYEADEASIIPILPMVEECLAKASAQSYERALINGHAAGVGGAGTHMDFDVVDTAGLQSQDKLFNGFRRLTTTVPALMVDNSGNAADFNFFATMEATMGKYGLNPDALVWIVGPRAIRRMKSIPQVQTVYAYGPNATIVTGKMENFDGIPVIASEWMRENVAATGVNTNAGPNTFGSCLLLRPDRFLTGRRRTFMIEIFREPWTQRNRIIASFRRSFVALETPSATVPSVVNGYNWI